MSDLDVGSVILRSTVEAALDAPLCVTIASARPGDGTTAVATGLARAFAEAGYRTIVVDANPLESAVGAAFGVVRLKIPAALDDGAPVAATTVGEGLDAASIADRALVDSTSSGALRAYIDELRSRYAAVILEAGDLFSSGLAVPCVTAADGTIIAVRYGRNPSPDDARAVTTLEAVGAKIIGVVPTGFPAARVRKSARGKVESEVAAAPIRRTGKSIA